MRTAPVVLALLALAAVPLAAQEVTATDTVAGVSIRTQRDLMDWLKGRHPSADSAPLPIVKFKKTIVPYVGYNPALGVVGGLSASASWRQGPRATTDVSTLAATAAYTSLSQKLFSIKSAIYTRDNKLNLQGDWRYYDTKQATYGLGPIPDKVNKNDVDFALLRFHQDILWSMGGGLFAGFGYRFDRYFNIVDRNATPGGPTTAMQDYYGGPAPTTMTSSGISFNFLYDTRDNPIAPSAGYYANASLQWNAKSLGSDNSWQGFYGEIRAYPRLDGPRTILGFWGYTWFTFGRAPYLALPAAQWDTYSRASRGYVQGRIRGSNQLYGELELRHTLTRDGLVGVVAFVNGLSTADPLTGELKNLDAGWGGGLRIKLDKRSGTNLAVDYGFGSGGSSTLFFAIGETF